MFINIYRCYVNLNDLDQMYVTGEIYNIDSAKDAQKLLEKEHNCAVRIEQKEVWRD